MPSHLWRFSEFYSSPDGSIQFIEMEEILGSAIEVGIGNHWYETNSYNQSHTELLGSNLVGNTAFKKFLVGSESYAALPDVPAPDYVLPDGVIDPSGDTIVWWFYQTRVIPPDTMPSDGVHSLVVVDPTLDLNSNVSGYTTAVNSPTNFAGETGTVVLPPPVPTMAQEVGGITALLVALLVGLGVASRWKTSGSG